MRNISIYASLLLMAGVAFTGCKEDTQPRLDKPTEFVLNTPPAADQLYIFRADDKNNSLNDITFTVSQPNYGVATTPDYQVQLAKSEEDFETWDEMVADNNYEDGEYNGQDGLPLVVTLDPPVTTAIITVSGSVFCEGVNTIYGFDEDNYNGEPVQVAVRVHAWIPNSNISSIFSNIIVLPKVSSYIPISAPGMLYIVGVCQGWNISQSDMVLNETEIGSKIYHGTYEIEEGEFLFRFYRALGDWDTNSIGAQVVDEPVDIELKGGVYEGPCVDGKGSWQVPGWGGGLVDMVVNLNTMTVTFTSLTEGREAYIVGACQGWNINGYDMTLKETQVGSNIYSGTFNINAGEFQFKIYTELGDWDSNVYGSTEDGADQNVDVTVPYNGPAYPGKGNWNVPSWNGGQVIITLDLNDNQISFALPE